jgi:predicted phosphodiesterase
MHLLFAVALALTQQWLLVSDLHVNPFDRAAVPDPYGTDTNWTLFDEALSQMRATVPNPRVVIVAGDFLAHKWSSKSRAAHWNPTAAAEQTMARIAGAFGRAYPRAQFVITMGNNDDPCGDYRARPGTAYMRALARIWQPLVNRNHAAPGFARDFSQAGYYTAALPDGSRAIVLDDIYFSTFYQPCGHEQGVAGRELAWLQRELHVGSPSVILMHIPPGIDGTGTLMAHRFLVIPFWRQDARRRFVHMLAANPRAVSLMIAGHTHRLGFRIVAGVPMLVASSISPIYNNNPAFFALKMGPGDVLEDYTEEADMLWQDAWEPFADFDTTFHAKRFDTQNLVAVQARIGQDAAERRRWELAMVAGSGVWRDIRRSWRAMWCAQTFMDGGYARCAGDVRRVTAFWVAALVAVALVLLAVFWFSYGMLKRRWRRQRRNG